MGIKQFGRARLNRSQVYRQVCYSNQQQPNHCRNGQISVYRPSQLIRTNRDVKRNHRLNHFSGSSLPSNRKTKCNVELSENRQCTWDRLLLSRLCLASDRLITMFDSTNYPYDVTYTVKPEHKPIVGLSAHYPSIEDYREIVRNAAEQDRIEYQRSKFNSEISELDGNWAEYLTA